jgi:hypothetical protein
MSSKPPFAGTARQQTKTPRKCLKFKLSMTAKTGETRDRAFKFSNELRSTAFETNIRSNSKMKRAQLRLKQNVQSSSLQLKEELPSTSPPEQGFKKTTARKQTKTNKFKSSPKKVARDI